MQKHYASPIVEVRTTETFIQWFRKLKDRSARAKIQARIDRMSLGNFGDVAPVGEGVSEMRVFYGPGYRVYFIQQGDRVVVLLAGGTKTSQQADIEQAKTIARALED